MNNFTIYTHGSCKVNPGPGGYAAIIESDQGRHELFGGEPETTNNRMELRAAIEGIKSVPKLVAIIVQSDCKYLVDNASNHLARWAEKGWKNIKNAPLWQEIHQLTRQYDIEWKYAHASETPEISDRLARLAAFGLTKQSRAA